MSVILENPRIAPIGPYQIQKRLGRGGMGVVFQAYDSTFRLVVAIKFLSPRLGVAPVAPVRCTREAQAAAAMNHPNVVTIYAIGEHEGLPFLVMEYVAGITLADRLNREGVLQLKSILRIGIQIARGLAAAHSQGLIHRDIKPAEDRFASASELARALVDHLAEIQGTKPAQALDDPDAGVGDPEPSPPPRLAQGFEIVDSCDELSPSPWAKGPAGDSGPATSTSRFLRRALMIVGIATAGVLAAIAMIFGLLWARQNAGENGSIVLLVALAFFAVLSWGFVQLRNAVSGARMEEPPKRVAAKRLRSSLAALALVITSGAAYVEWQAREQATRALRAVSARQAGIGQSVITRREIESLIRRSADEASPGSLPGDVSVTYRWRGIFRTHQLRALYRRNHPGRKPLEQDSGSDVLLWINDVAD